MTTTNRTNNTISNKRSNFKELYIYFLLLSFAFLISSCKKFVEVPNPVNEVQTVDVFQNDQTALSALSGLYGQMSSIGLQFTYGGLSVFGGLSADDIYNTSVNATYDPFYKNAIPSNEQTTNLNRFWTRAYTLIYQANAILEGLNKSTQLKPSIKTQIQGEAIFTRAFCYFYLVNLYGDVPLITTTDYAVNGTMVRTAVANVYQQIIADLKEAQSLLPTDYPSSGKVRPNKWTATAILARVYLYVKDYPNAESEANSIINSNTYSLETTDINRVFKINSSETIWELIPPVGVPTQEGVFFIPSSTTAKPTFAVTSFLFNAFEATDIRKTNWLKANTIGTPPVSYYYPYKYKTRIAPVTEYNIVFRLAEEYLIRAEVRAQQNNISGAQSDLNIIRSRAGLLNTLANDKASLLTAIENERQVEFFAEWGHRWFDLKRTNLADAVLGVEKSPNWQSTDALYPIPFSEIQTNPFLTQNLGY